MAGPERSILGPIGLSFGLMGAVVACFLDACGLLRVFELMSEGADRRGALLASFLAFHAVSGLGGGGLLVIWYYARDRSARRRSTVIGVVGTLLMAGFWVVTILVAANAAGLGKI